MNCKQNTQNRFHREEEVPKRKTCVPTFLPLWNVCCYLIRVQPIASV